MSPLHHVKGTSAPVHLPGFVLVPRAPTNQFDVGAHLQTGTLCALPAGHCTVAASGSWHWRRRSFIGLEGDVPADDLHQAPGLQAHGPIVRHETTGSNLPVGSGRTLDLPLGTPISLLNNDGPTRCVDTAGALQVQ